MVETDRGRGRGFFVLLENSFLDKLVIIIII